MAIAVASPSSTASSGTYEIKLRLYEHKPSPGLLMNNARKADPTDEFTQRIAALTGQRKKEIGDHEEIARLEWEAGLYWDEDIGPYIPCRNVLNAILESAAKFKLKKTLRTAMVESSDGDYRLPLLYDGPRDIEGMWEAKYYNKQSLKQNQSRVMRTRPCFHDWELPEFTLTVDAQECTRKKLEPVLARLHRVGALGDFRPQFGRFDMEVEG